MKPLTIISLTALVLASVWIAQSPADNPDKLPLPELSLPLPQDQPPVEPAPEPNSESGPAVVWQDQVVTEWVRSCDGRSCRLVPRQVVRRVAVAAAKPIRTARVIFAGGVERTLELLRPVGAAVTCTRTTAQAQTGEQWMGTDEQIYVKQSDGTWKPKRADAKIPESAPLRYPAVSYSIPVRQVSYSPVMTSGYRARTPVYLFPRLRARLRARWCR